MVGIADEHVEYAVVKRLKAMLDEPPKTMFNVTQSFALFSTILLWIKNRVWVAGNEGARQDWPDQKDHNAHNAREKMRATNIVAHPWLLSTTRPRFTGGNRERELPLGNPKVNTDFEEMNAEVFFKWLRDAIAHGDGRTIRPIHNLSNGPGKTLLTGFEIVFEERKGSKRLLTLALYNSDLIHI